MEKLVEWTVLAGETEVLGKNLPRATLSTRNPTWQTAKTGRRGGKPATNRFSYDVLVILAVGFCPFLNFCLRVLTMVLYAWDCSVSVLLPTSGVAKKQTGLLPVLGGTGGEEASQMSHSEMADLCHSARYKLSQEGQMKYVLCRCFTWGWQQFQTSKRSVPSVYLLLKI
jgi:hypothetical protein